MNQERQGKKSTAKIVAIVIIVMFALGVAVGFVIGKQIKKQHDYVAKQEKLLNDELAKIMAQNPAADEVDQTIYTEKEYAKVEKSMKAYFTEMFAAAKKVNDLASDERFSILMNQDQMLADAPEFTNTLAAIDTFKSEYTAGVDAIAECLEEEKVMSYLDTTLEQEYQDMYKEMMLNEDTVWYEKSFLDEPVASKEQITNLLDVYKEMVDFLVVTQDKWTIEDSTFMFTEQAALEQYNAYVGKVDEMWKK